MEIVPDSSRESEEVGNTKPQIPPAKHWCFTLFDYNDDDILDICSNSSNIYVFQEEVCPTTGKAHLQGYIKFSQKCRPMHKFKSTMHWEKCNNIDASIKYAQKIETRKKGGRLWCNKVNIDEKIKIIKDLKPFQLKIKKMIQEEPDDRTINWFWEKKGCIGKTALCKYLAVNYKALVVSGKGTDCLYAIVKWKEETGLYPKIVILDIPRTAIDYVSYTAIEKIKDGLFFSGKYESSMVVMNSPHVICFANEKPNVNALSKDRWNIKEVK